MEPLTDAQIDAFDEANPNAAAIFTRIHERRRRRAHAAAKAKQPRLHLRETKTHDALLATLKAEFRSPITTEDEDPGGVDYLLQTVQDCLDAGDFEDTVFALMRVARKAYAWNRHLGPINPAEVKRG